MMNGHYGSGGGYNDYMSRDRRGDYGMRDDFNRRDTENPYQRGGADLTENPYQRGGADLYSSRLPESREDPYSRRLPNHKEANGRDSPQGRGDPGPVYELDHLATFTVSKNQGIVSPQHGIDRLKQMEVTTGIWTMRCKLYVKSKDIIIVDKHTSDEMERFPLDLVVEPTARVNSGSQNDAYDNMVLFTVLGDQQRGMESEMHIFQCIGRSAESLVDDIMDAKEGRGHKRSASPPRGPAKPHPPSYDAVAAERAARATADYRPGPQPGPAFRQSMARDDAESDLSDRTDRDVQILNHCFDDIEKFAVRLQHAADAFMELERRINRRDKKNKHKAMGDGMLTMRARPPPAKDFVDVFQKFKLSFNVLARLKNHIHDPNAPELVHFIFTPLSLACDASRDPQRGTPDLASKVVSPLLTRDARDLLQNCLTSKEMELWRSLGDAWTVCRDEWKGYVPPYIPRFSNGWNPSPSVLDDQSVNPNRDHRDRPEEHARYDFEHEREMRDRELRDLREQEARERAREEDPYSRGPDRRDPDPRDYPSGARSRSDHDRYDRGRSPQRRDSDRRNGAPEHRGHSPVPARAASPGPPRNDYGKRPDNRHMDFYQELSNKGLRACEVLHDRTGNNERELTIHVGDILEVLDSSRNWWKLRNQSGRAGHAPFNYLKLLPAGGVR